MPTFRFPTPFFRQTAFALVELITVILILGVLAAVAIPRYADLQGKARESKVHAVSGSMKAAAGILGAANVESDGGWTSALVSGALGAAGAVLDLRLNDAATPADCKVTYTAAATPPAKPRSPPSPAAAERAEEGATDSPTQPARR
jgi:MSHA pilin protein MshA